MTGGGRRVGPSGAVGAGLLTAVCVVGAVVCLAGCGGGIASPDLFLVERSGSVAGARLTLLVNDGGVVHCDGGPALAISDAQLVQARGIQEELKDAASKHLVLLAKQGSVLGYYVRDQDGTVRFADNSAGQSRTMRELALFVLQVAQGICHRGL